MQNVKEIRNEFQHALVVADIDKKKIWNVIKNVCTERRKINLQIDVKIGKRF